MWNFGSNQGHVSSPHERVCHLIMCGKLTGDIQWLLPKTAASVAKSLFSGGLVLFPTSERLQLIDTTLLKCYIKVRCQHVLHDVQQQG